MNIILQRQDFWDSSSKELLLAPFQETTNTDAASASGSEESEPVLMYRLSLEEEVIKEHFEILITSMRKLPSTNILWNVSG